MSLNGAVQSGCLPAPGKQSRKEGPKPAGISLDFSPDRTSGLAMVGDSPPLLQAMAEKVGGEHSLMISDRGGQEEPPNPVC